jgi:hypothetical protein
MKLISIVATVDRLHVSTLVEHLRESTKVELLALFYLYICDCFYVLCSVILLSATMS